MIEVASGQWLLYSPKSKCTIYVCPVDLRQLFIDSRSNIDMYTLINKSAPDGSNAGPNTSCNHPIIIIIFTDSNIYRLKANDNKNSVQMSVSNVL